jgi:hypothetical protein
MIYLVFVVVMYDIGAAVGTCDAFSCMYKHTKVKCRPSVYQTNATAASAALTKAASVLRHFTPNCHRTSWSQSVMYIMLLCYCVKL